LGIALFLVAEPSLAGPGGKIARAAFETFWGRVVLGVLVVLFSPLIVYTFAKERAAERRTLKDLAYLARSSSHFDWLPLRQRISECFHRVHAAWLKEDVAEAANWMTDWYWQNQQGVHLDKWAQQGAVNFPGLGSTGYVETTRRTRGPGDVDPRTGSHGELRNDGDHRRRRSPDTHLF
jgi:hypothetical protein